MQVRLLFVTTSRADWGIMSGAVTGAAMRDGVSVCVLAGNMHLSDQYGKTIDEVTAACNLLARKGAEISLRHAQCPPADGTALSATKIMSAMALATATAIDSFKPDVVVLLGDRYEILGAASAALFSRTPVVHLHGGEVTKGAIDDNVRNAVSMIASLHLVATEEAANRLAHMGVNPKSIIHTGAMGVENIVNHPAMSRKELSESLDGFDISAEKTLLVTFHPVTRHPNGLSPQNQTDNLLDALDGALNAGFNIIVTAPNNDPGSEYLHQRLMSFARSRRHLVKFVPSLGHARYLSALRHVRAVVGNSSSGIIEAPSTGADTIDIGPRQDGRERASTVIHVSDSDSAEITRAIIDLKNTPRREPRPELNPYFRHNAAQNVVNAILNHIR